MIATIREQIQAGVRPESPVARGGAGLARYGLAVVIAWIGMLKFTEYEANGIAPFVSNSPFMSWLYDIFSITTFSSLLGVVEIAIAVLLAVKPWFPRLSAIGSLMAIGMFATTLTFVLSTPGVASSRVVYESGLIRMPGVSGQARRRGVRVRSIA
ncbi:YkgB family protein [Mycobacterium avium subsp. hominissuis]|uniref:YkgB family protein n=1 Tax=Mycobacterium avium TaxID=1764 RepID=UPI00313DBD94